MTINTWFKNNNKKKPKIGILGLNPHNAELRKKSEENKIIIPAIKKLTALKLNIKGPLVSDTLFINDYKKFDVIVGCSMTKFSLPLRRYINLMRLTLP